MVPYVVKTSSIRNPSLFTSFFQETARVAVKSNSAIVKVDTLTASRVGELVCGEKQSFAEPTPVRDLLSHPCHFF
jgi:hypothetical protein